MQKILIVRVSSLGDVVHNMPMVSDLRRHFPDAQIDWVVEEAYVELVRLHADVQRVIPFALRRWRKHLLARATRAEIGAFLRELRASEYDFVFDTQGLFKTGLLMRAARLAPGGRRVGLANATEGSGYEGISRIFHDLSVPVGVRTHGVTRSREVAAAAAGYTLDEPVDFRLRVPELGASGASGASGALAASAASDYRPEPPYALLFHATARAAKQWSRDGWIQVAHALAQRGIKALLPWGSASEHAAAQALAAAMPGAEVMPRVSVLEATALIGRATVVIGVDTGLTHIAAALGRPTIELYCDSPLWKTEGFWSPEIVNLGDTGAPPEPAQVLAALDRLLGPAAVKEAAPVPPEPKVQSGSSPDIP